MKKVKYLFVFLVTLCFMPNIVSATQNVYFKEYKIGDKITVTLDEKGEVKGNFIVIENSDEKNISVSDDYDFGSATEDYQYVTAIYEGIIGESFYIDPINLPDVYPVSCDDISYSEVPEAALRTMVNNATELDWYNYDSIRLLNSTDIDKMKKSAGISYDNELKGKYPWLVLENKTYWIMGGKTICRVGYFNSNDVITGYQMEIISTASAIGSYGIVTAEIYSGIREYKNGIKNMQERYGLRPVITIHKQYVENGMVSTCTDCEEEPKEEKVCPNDLKISIQKCIDEGTTEEACIKKLCPGTEKTENPKTGSYVPFIVLGLGMIAFFACALTKNKAYFRKIKKTSKFGSFF